MKLDDYAIRIEPLSREEGGGFLVTVPDLLGTMAVSVSQRDWACRTRRMAVSPSPPGVASMTWRS